jgi:hypothetical protein
MTIQKVNNYMMYGLASDTKPTTYPANTLFIEQDTGKIFRYTGSAWANLLTAENTGKAVASGNGSTTVFNIAHAIGANPTIAMANCASHVNTYTYTTDSTNIVVTFTTAPPSGTNNVIIYWRAVA